MQAVQLTLDDALEQAKVTCPRCGYAFNARHAELRAKLAGLSPATRAVWLAGGHRFQRGREYVGPSELAARANLAVSTVSYHLMVLLQVGLVRAIPQNQYRRHRHVYTGTL